MRFLLLMIFIGCSWLGVAQKQDYIWILGTDQNISEFDQGYRFDFNKTPFEPFLSNNGAVMDNNNACICDGNGNLLFFTNGCGIFNKDYEYMENGDSLNYDVWMENLGWVDCKYGYPGFQDLMILSDPANDQGYYLLHKIKKFKGLNIQDGLELMNSYIDISANDDLGKVAYKNQSYHHTSRPMTSYLTAINHSNAKDWWVIQPLEEDSIFLTFLIDENGIQRKEDQNTHQYYNSYRSSASGTAKFSPDGSKYAIYNYYDGLHVFDFDRSTGKLTNHKEVEIYNDIQVSLIKYSSVEWSPNSRFIYTASREDLHQIDTWESDYQDGVRLIDTYNGTQDPFSTRFFLMAQAPNCKIYMCPTSSTNTYHVIHKPDELGVACDFVQNGMKLPKTSGVASFPNFPRFRVDEEEKCDPTITSFLGDEVYYRRDLGVYPNPVQQDLNITIPEQQSGQVIIYNIEGKVLMGPIAVSNQTDIHQVDVSALSSGTYIVEYVSDDRKERLVYNQKFVKL